MHPCRVAISAFSSGPPTRRTPPANATKSSDIASAVASRSRRGSRPKDILEQALRLGIGKIAADALLFAGTDGGPLSPNAVSAAWAHSPTTSVSRR
jgi:hypothetical protein